MPERTLKFKMTGDTTDFTRKWTTAQATMTRVATQAQALGQKVSGFGRKMATSFTLPITIALGGGVKAFANFDKAMTESLAIMGDVSEGTQKQMAALAKQMSGESTFAAKELAEAYFFLASAGLDAQESMQALPIVTKFAQSGAFDMAVATDLLTDAFSALGPQIQKTGDFMKDMTGLGDILVKANTLANATVQQFSEALTNEAGPAMRQWKIDTEDGVAVLAAFADQGIKGQKAGSMFGRAIRLLTKAYMGNTSEFRKMNIQIFDAQGEFRSFADIAGDLERALGSLSTEQRAAALTTLGFQARTQQAILPLIGSSEKIRQYREDLKDAGGTMDEVSQKQLQTFSNQMTILKNKVVNAFAALGEALIPTITKIAAKIEEWTAKFQALSPETKRVIANTLLWVAAIGPGLMILGKLIGTFGTLITVLKGVATAAAFLAANPLVAPAAALAAVVGWVVKLGLDAGKAMEQERESAEAWADQLARVKAEYGSLENLRAQNRARWARDAQAREDFQKVLKSEFDLQSKIEALQSISKRGLSDTIIKEIQAKLDILKKEAEALKPTATPTATPFAPSEEDKKKQEEFQKALEKAMFDQLGVQQKINQLYQKRSMLQAQIDKAQKGSGEFFDAQKEALKVEADLRALGKERGEEIKARAKRDIDQTKVFAQAAEKGSIEDYRLRIRAGRRDKALKIQEDMKKQLKELNKEMAENTDILREGFGAATGATPDVVVIA